MTESISYCHTPLQAFSSSCYAVSTVSVTCIVDLDGQNALSPEMKPLHTGPAALRFSIGKNQMSQGTKFGLPGVWVGTWTFVTHLGKTQ